MASSTQVCKSGDTRILAPLAQAGWLLLLQAWRNVSGKGKASEEQELGRRSDD